MSMRAEKTLNSEYSPCWCKTVVDLLFEAFYIQQSTVSQSLTLRIVYASSSETTGCQSMVESQTLVRATLPPSHVVGVTLATDEHLSPGPVHHSLVEISQVQEHRYRRGSVGTLNTPERLQLCSSRCEYVVSFFAASPHLCPPTSANKIEEWCTHVWPESFVEEWGISIVVIVFIHKRRHSALTKEYR
ncbi:hypothetical protein DMENIID0001_093060 [Sergentomyia squamirostris]